MLNDEIEYVLVMPPATELALDDCIHYISYKLNAPQAAKNLLNEFRQGFKTICKYPNSCSECLDEFYRSKNYRKLFVNNYVALYKVDEEIKQITIMHVFYAPSNYQSKI